MVIWDNIKESFPQGMPKNYQNIIIILVLVALFGAGIFIYKQENGINPEQEIFSLPAGTTLTEEQQDKFDKAKQDLKENPNNVKALIALAQVKYVVYDLEGSKVIYLKALDLQPTNTLILNNLGDIYNQQKEYEKSAEMYLRIIKSNPKWISAYRELAAIYKFHLKERYSKMEEILLQGLEKNKEFTKEAPVDFYSMLAVYYNERGETDKAIEYFEKVIELTPENEGAKIELEELKKL